MRVLCCAAVLLAALTTPSWAATRAYVMNGLFVGNGLAVIAAQLRARGYIVTYGSYEENRAFAADACAHTDDRIVVNGLMRARPGQKVTPQEQGGGPAGPQAKN